MCSVSCFLLTNPEVSQPIAPDFCGVVLSSIHVIAPPSQHHPVCTTSPHIIPSVPHLPTSSRLSHISPHHPVCLTSPHIIPSVPNLPTSSRLSHISPADLSAYYFILIHRKRRALTPIYYQLCPSFIWRRFPY